MAKTRSRPPTDELYTPEELLGNAEYLLALDDPKAVRASVLEAVTALEGYVHDVVFSVLPHKMDALLVKWLEDRTKMDFDCRLSLLTPFATGTPVDMQSGLWQDYKDARKIRNEVAHAGHKVSVERARFVLRTVYAWLGYLGSTAGLERALTGLKLWLETSSSIRSGRDAERAVAEYLAKTSPAKAYLDYMISSGRRSVRADVVLQFGQKLTLVEVKYRKTPVTPDRLQQVIEQTLNLMNQGPEIAQGAAVIIQTGPREAGVPEISRYHEGRVLAVVVCLPAET